MSNEVNVTAEVTTVLLETSKKLQEISIKSGQPAKAVCAYFIERFMTAFILASID